MSSVDERMTVRATDPLWAQQAAPRIRPDRPDALAFGIWDVAVVGGGIAGLMAARAAAASGRRVCVVDAQRVGDGATGRATAKVTAGHGALLAEIAEHHGLSAAVEYQRSNDRGLSIFESLVPELPDDVGWETQPHLTYGVADDVAKLERTATIAAPAGSDVRVAAPPAWALRDARSWTWPASYLVNPLSLARSLARQIQQAKVPVVERARALQVEDADEYVRVRLQGGIELRARDVVIATHAPAFDPDLRVLRMGYFRRPVIAVPVNGDPVPASFDVGGWSTRPATLPDGSRGAVVVGPRARVGSLDAPAWTDVEDWATVALHAGPAVAVWAAQDPRTTDLLPSMGRSSKRPHVIVITGMNAWGFTNAASFADDLPRLLDSPAGETTAGHDSEESLEGHARSAAALASDAWATTRGLVRGVTHSLHLDSSSPAVGEGKVVGGPLHPVATCRTRDGRLHAVSARCTHLGCLVGWNQVEESWDCPCHGSRFAADGTVLEGPAVTDLEPATEED